MINRGRNVIGDVVGVLGEHSCYFQVPEYARLYSLIHTMYIKGSYIDLMTLIETSKTVPEYKGLYLVITDVMTAEWYKDVVNGCVLLKEHYLERKLLSISMDTVTELNRKDRHVLDILNSSISHINDLPRMISTESSKSPIEIYDSMIENIGAMARGEIPKGLDSGFPQLDYITGGFKNGDLIVIGARPSMGKTSIALSMAANMLVEGIPFGFFSLEVNELTIYQKLASLLSGVPFQRLRDGQTTEEEDERLRFIRNAYIKRPHIISSPNAPNVNQIKAMIIDWKRRFNIQCVFIDYMGFIRPEKSFSREQEVAGISKAIKNMAKEFNIPIILLSQLNREAEKRDGGRPKLTDLRESGSIEQDADLVMFLHRPERMDITEEDGVSTEGKAELAVAKHRNGSLGKINLFFDKNLVKFIDTCLIDTEAPS